MSNDQTQPIQPPQHIHPMSLYTDNILKFVIAGLVAVLVWISKEQIGRLDRIETDVAGLKIQMAEIRIDLKHLKP